MKVLLAFLIITSGWIAPAWAQTDDGAGPGGTPAAPNYSVPPLPPSVKPITPDNPAGPAQPHPRVVPPPASEDFEPPPETAQPNYSEPLSSEELEAAWEAVDPSWHVNSGDDIGLDEEAGAPEDPPGDDGDQPVDIEDEDDEASWETALEGHATEEMEEAGNPDSGTGETSASSFEELLIQRDGVEFEYEGSIYVWRDGVPFEKNRDGTLMALEPPDDLYVVADDGRQWLSRSADGDVYINVAPRIWATINFSNNSNIIEEESEPVLDVFGESLAGQALSRHRLIIAGHTSRTGSQEYNLKLSRQRAQSVSHYLVERHGIDPGRLILHGYGFTKPIADNETEEGQALNRRVEFILLGPVED